MSIKGKRIIDIMENIAPSYLAEDWDNIGLQIGNPENLVQKMMICLEVTPAVIDEAISQKIDCIISHHPLIFKPLKNVNTSDVVGAMVYKLIQHDIMLYCAHTNLDIAEEGTNDVLANLLGLQNTRPLIVTEDEKNHDQSSNPLSNRHGLGRIGNLNEATPLSMFCEDIKLALETSKLKVVGDVNSVIHTVGICGGSGAEFIFDAFKAGCDCYITGDVKYHDAQYALQLGMAVIDAGHFETERFICQALAEKLNKIVDTYNFSCEVLVSNTYINPFQIL